MKVTLVWGSSAWSIRDVTTGLRSALLRAGHEVRDYRLDNRLELMRRAFPAEMQETEVCRMASENVLAEATYHQADLVLIVSGVLFHEAGLWLLQHYRLPTAVVMTESPYSDQEQRRWIYRYPHVTVFTQERTSAAREGWFYLPAAYDVDVHRPVAPSVAEASDVLLVGTGFEERQRLLEAVDWTGINFRLQGYWPAITADSRIFQFHVPGCVNNGELPPIYAATKIALNPYRDGDGAESLNPRAYELAACGVFQVSSYRRECEDVFGDAIPMYRSAEELETLIRYYLAHPDERQTKADAARMIVQGQTFDQRVDDIMTVLAPHALVAAG